MKCAYTDMHGGTYTCTLPVNHPPPKKHVLSCYLLLNILIYNCAYFHTLELPFSDVMCFLAKIENKSVLLLLFQGEEVYNTYGPLTNQELLHMYGFTERYPLNTHDSVSCLHVLDFCNVQTYRTSVQDGNFWYHNTAICH